MSEVLHQKLYDGAISTLQKYSLAEMAKAFNISTINNMILAHKEKLLSIKSLEQAIEMLNAGLADKFGVATSIDVFITDPEDLEKIYDILILWRDSILTDA
jgi:hypothetical protein